MKINKIIAGLIFCMFFASCGEDEKIDCGKTLTWKAEEESITLKAVAGEECSNYSDYYDADLNQIITKIQSMKFVLNRKCYEMTAVDSDPEEVEVECPEFVPETIEFGELTECSFSTPQEIPENGASGNCNVPEMRLIFKVENTSQIADWTFYDVGNPSFKAENKYSLGRHSFDVFENEIFMAVYFRNEELTSAGVVFNWTEDEVEKTLEFSATVEMKE